MIPSTNETIREYKKEAKKNAQERLSFFRRALQAHVLENIFKLYIKCT